MKSQVKKKESECKFQENQILKLNSQLEKEKKEKKEAIEKVNAIYQISRPQDSVMDKEAKGEYMEEFSPDDKRKSEAVEEEGGSQKKPRCNL